MKPHRTPETLLQLPAEKAGVASLHRVYALETCEYEIINLGYQPDTPIGRWRREMGHEGRGGTCVNPSNLDVDWGGHKTCLA